jgi:hypothetical protein
VALTTILIPSEPVLRSCGCSPDTTPSVIFSRVWNFSPRLHCCHASSVRRATVGLTLLYSSQSVLTQEGQPCPRWCHDASSQTEGGVFFGLLLGASVSPV